MTVSIERYSALSRTIHWVTALLIVVLFGVGLYMGEVPKEDPLRAQLYFMHQSFGVLTVLLLVLRLVWLRVKPAPQLPEAFSAKDRKVVLGVRGLLYLLMILVPLSGVVIVFSAGRDVPFFGLLSIPSLLPKSESLHEFAEEMHELLAYGIIGLMLVHMAGAIKHRVKNRGGSTDILTRMI